MSSLRLPNTSTSGAFTKFESKTEKRKRTKWKKRQKFSKKQTKELLKKKSQNDDSTRQDEEAPKSFIITRGKVTHTCETLRDDLRLLFSPYTALKLQVLLYLFSLMIVSTKKKKN